MGKRVSTVVAVLLVAVGLALLLYPTVADWWNSSRQSKAFDAYDESLAELDDGTRERLLAEAQAYNEALAQEDDGRFVMSDEERAVYDGLLDVDGNGMMGTLEIPSIGVRLAIYHGTSSAVLQTAAGHLEGSSLPVGGEGTHAVISGHRGLPSARLLTDLDKVELGDIFTLQVLGETLTYEVDQILTVEPTDVSALAIEEGEDLCTLVTCTPYGINTHRLLVRGHRVYPEADNATPTSNDALGTVTVDSTFDIVVPVVAGLVLAGLICVVMRAVRRHGADEAAREEEW